MAANGSRLFAAQRSWRGTFALNEVAPKTRWLKLVSTTKFPRQNTVNNGCDQACGGYRGVDGSAGHWRLFSVWVDWTLTAALGSCYNHHVDSCCIISLTDMLVSSIAWYEECCHFILLFMRITHIKQHQRAYVYFRYSCVSVNQRANFQLQSFGKMFLNQTKLAW